MREDLPAVLATYLARAGASALGRTGTLVHQRGEIRLAPDKPWLPFSAEQTLEARKTGFVWHARVKMAPLVTGVVEDAFEDGHGRLDAKIWGVIPVAHARGIDIDRGEAQRYVAELPWCPAAIAHNPELHFEPTDERTVRVWAGDDTAWVDLSFDAAGDIELATSTTRKRDGVAQPWAGRFFDYRDFGGIRAPSRAEVWWDPPQGRFTYFRAEVVSLQPR